MEQIQQLENTLKYTKTDTDRAIVHNNIGVLYEKLGNMTKALEHHKRELKASRSSISQSMIACRFIAECYRKLKKFKKSLQYNERHFEYASKLSHKLEQQRSYCNKGNAHLDLSEVLLEKDQEEDFHRHMTMALDNFRLSLKLSEVLTQEITQQPGIEDKEKIITNFKRLCNEALYNIGNTYFVWGKYDNKHFGDALDYLKRASALAKSLNNPILEGKCYSSIGLIFFNKKEYDQAEGFLKKDAKICEENKDYPGLMHTLRNIARVFHAKREYTNSIQFFEKAKDICKKFLDSDEIDEIQEEIQEVQNERLLKLENDEKIKKFDQLEKKKEFNKEYFTLGKAVIECLCDRLEDFQKALNIAKPFLASINKMTAGNPLTPGMRYLTIKILSYLGMIHQNLKKYDEAKKYLKEAMKILEENDPSHTKSADYLALMIDLANVLDDAGEPAQDIVSIYWKAFELGDKSGHKHILKPALNNLEMCYRKEKDKKGIQRVKDMKIKYFPDDFAHTSIIEEESESDFGESSDEQNEAVYEDSRMKPEPEHVTKTKHEEKHKHNFMEPEDSLFRVEDSEKHAHNERHTHNQREPLIEKHSHNKKQQTQTSSLDSNNDYIPPSKLRSMEIEKQPQNKSPTERYFEYLGKYNFASSSIVQSQVDNKIFNIKNEFLPNWVVKSALKALKYNKKLEELNLKNNRMTIDGFMTLQKYISSNCFPKLKKINLSYNPIKFDTPESKVFMNNFLTVLCRSKTLEYINLSGITLGIDLSRALFAAVDNSKSLLTLKLKDCTIQGVFPEFRENNSIAKLDLAQNALDTGSLQALLYMQKFKSLRQLDLSNQFYILPAHVPFQSKTELHSMVSEDSSQNHRLEKLELRGFDFRDHINVFNSHIKGTFSNLEYLDVSESKNLDMLFDSLEGNLMQEKIMGLHSNLRIKRFKANDVRFSHDDKISSLFKFIAMLRFLQELEVQENDFREKDIEKLSEILVSFCMYISSINVLGTIHKVGLLEGLKSNLPGLKWCYSDL